jgi:hypothetical protein
MVELVAELSPEVNLFGYPEFGVETLLTGVLN